MSGFGDFWFPEGIFGDEFNGDMFVIPIKKGGTPAPVKTEPLVLERSACTLAVYLDNGVWTTEHRFHQPYEKRSSWGGSSEMIEFEKNRVSEHQLLNLLTAEEVRLLLGYCAHILEQGFTHLTYMYTAVGEALERKDWTAMLNQLPEFHDEIRAHEAVRALATNILSSNEIAT